MKYPSYLDYSQEGTRRCESALLTVWAVLRDERDNLVLVGGLVPRYLCKHDNSSLEPVTMDIDLGISIGTSSGQYDSVFVRLQNAGFEAVQKEPGHPVNRLIKKLDNGTKLILDLLTEKPAPDAPDSVQLEGLWVDAFLGVGRALKIYRDVPIKGQDLYGAEVTETIKIAEIGPFLCLKLNSYSGRAESKDVFDIVYGVTNYDKGPEQAAKLFQAETGVNPAFEPAISALDERFKNEKSKGPVQYADFCTRGQPDSADLKMIKARYANEAVDVARLLLKTK